MIKKSKLGMIGLGDRSTRFYLQQINKRFNLEKGNFSTCPLWINNVDFNTVNPYLPDEKQIIKEHINIWITEMRKIEIDRLIIPNITINKFITKDYENVVITNPIKETIDKLKSENINSIVLVGSKYTMSSKAFTNLFSDDNIAINAPTEEQLFFCDEIRKKVYSSTDTLKDIADFQNFIVALAENNKVVIACTELSIAMETINDKNIYDMVDIQIESFLK